MKLSAMREGAENTIKRSQEVAAAIAAGANLEPIPTGGAERILEVLDRIVPEITPEEWRRLQAGILGVNDDAVIKTCKDIKERHGLSWNELRMLRASDGGRMRLKDFRIAAGLSQSELAARSGVSLRTLQEYEQGRKPINMAAGIKLYNLAKALGCRIEDLLEI